MKLRLAARRRAWRKRRRAFGRRVRRIVVRTLLIAVLVPALWVAAYRFIDPPVTYLIAAEWVRLGDVEREWRDLDEMSPHLPRAAMGGEDARFCAHYGFDFEEIAKALAEDDRRRGASTITQQVAKNVFLWPDASWLRKGLEAGFTVLIELFWPKRRTMEVYLNVAEMGEGVFGAEAAARRYFGRSADELTLVQSARIAAALPNPKARDPSRPSNFLIRRGRSIADGAETLRANGGADCLHPP
ncbi:MAG: monofunctional biosynthetic peptidoglycan transglycosylase [Pseudomonadota bacterium]